MLGSGSLFLADVWIWHSFVFHQFPYIGQVAVSSLFVTLMFPLTHQLAALHCGQTPVVLTFQVFADSGRDTDIRLLSVSLGLPY